MLQFSQKPEHKTKGMIEPIMGDNHEFENWRGDLYILFRIWGTGDEWRGLRWIGKYNDRREEGTGLFRNQGCKCRNSYGRCERNR
jgi:hypothetical protein